MQHATARRPEGALLGGAHRGHLVINPCALGRGQHVARRRRIEHAQSDIRARSHVLEKAQHAFAAVGLHHRRLDVNDVSAGLLGVQRQIHTVLRRHGRRACLHHHTGVDAARLLDRHLQQAFALVEGQRPELGDAAGAPQHRVPEIADAVAHQRPVGVPVDVVAVGAAERGVEGITDPPQCAGRPRARLCCRSHSRLLLSANRFLRPVLR